MEKQEIGRFNAITFNDITIEFIVYNDNTIDCPSLGLESYNRIVIKPRFVLSGNGKFYTYDVKAKIKTIAPPELIANYDIDDELFNYLKQKNMICYSTDMAYFYGFNDKKGYDAKRPGIVGTPSPYKHAKKKGPILLNQHNCRFN